MLRHTLAAAAALALGMSGAQAAQITLGNSTTAGYSFTGLGGGQISVSQSTMTGQAFDPASLGIGSYTLTGFGPITVTNDGTGVFPISGVTATLTYTNGGNSLTDTVTWTSINDNSHNPHFEGTDVINSSSGSAAFLAAFPTGSATHIDITTTQLVTTLVGLAAGQTETAGISSGEVVTLAPEPMTVALLGTGLIGLGVVARRRR